MRNSLFSDFIFVLLIWIGEARRKWPQITEARRKRPHLTDARDELVGFLRSSKANLRRVHHLVVLQHGLGGEASDWSFFAKTLQNLSTGSQWIHSGWADDSQNKSAIKNDPSEHVQVIFWAASYDSESGIRGVGESLAAGITQKQIEYMRKGKPIKYLSLVGHSMGGLFLRYAVKSLYESGALSVSRNSTLRPVLPGMELRNYFTIATPHLSVWRPNDAPLDFVFNLATNAVSTRSIREVSLNDARVQTGVDADSARQPLLYRMATEENFTKPLASFRRGVLYANVYGDTQIWYESGAIRAFNPYRGPGSYKTATGSEQYPHVYGCTKSDDERNFTTSNYSSALRKVRRPYWAWRHTGRIGRAVGHMFRKLRFLKFGGEEGWERCDVNIDGPFSMHVNHWLILGTKKGPWKVEDPAMHIMQNLILGDEHFKNSRYPFQVLCDDCHDFSSD